MIQGPCRRLETRRQKNLVFEVRDLGYGGDDLVGWVGRIGEYDAAKEPHDWLNVETSGRSRAAQPLGKA